MGTETQTDRTKGERIRLACLKCAGGTAHVVQTSVDLNGDVDGWYRWWESYQVVQCQGCETYSFRRLKQDNESTYIDDTGEEQLIDHVELYPPRIAGRAPMRHLLGLPQMVRVLYEETHKALSNKQPILAGVGIRALIETICRDKSAKGRTLEKKIDNLVALGVLTADGAGILHKLRDLGNAAAHDAAIYSDAALGTAFEVVEHLLLGVYVLPRRAAALSKAKRKN